MRGIMRYSYILPDLASYRAWHDFDGDCACVKRAGYDAVELQIADPAGIDEKRLDATLAKYDLPLIAVQTGGTYVTRGNCLSSPDAEVRVRTIALLKSFADFAARKNLLLVFGSLQGGGKDEADANKGLARIDDALAEVAAYADEKRVVIAYEPVNYLEVGYRHTIDSVAKFVRALNRKSLRLMVDTFHMNIEESSLLEPLNGIRDILVHVHLSDSNRGVLGSGHFPIADFIRALKRIGYAGYCSIGVYHSDASRAEAIERSLKHLKALDHK